MVKNAQHQGDAAPAPAGATMQDAPGAGVGASGGSPQRSTGHADLLAALALLRRERQETRGVLTVILFDVDRFHMLNERFSPHVGDEVLTRVEEIIEEAGGGPVRTFRFTGDQFLSVLTDASADEAVAFSERCRRALVLGPVVVEDRAVEITLSAGIVESSAGCPETLHQLISRARIALNQAKHQGGNRIVTWMQVMSGPFRDAATRSERNGSAHWHVRLRQHVRSTQMESMRALVAAVDARDAYTRTHSQTVASFAERIGRAMDLHGARLEALIAASLLHDVGKIGVPDAILTKPGPLSEEEFETVKRHPETAVEILRNMSFLGETIPLVLHHHERFDGRGYPHGLKGSRIPIGARIIAVADALDTMLSPRTYKPAYTLDRARAELVNGAGGQFDPQVVRAALELFPTTSSLPQGAVQSVD